MTGVGIATFYRPFAGRAEPFGAALQDSSSAPRAGEAGAAATPGPPARSPRTRETRTT